MQETVPHHFKRACKVQESAPHHFKKACKVQESAPHHFKRACKVLEPGRVAQSVTCLATDACLTADPGVASSIPARYHTFVEIDHEIISTVILLLPLIYSRRVVVSYNESMCTNYWLTACSSLPRKKCG